MHRLGLLALLVASTAHAQAPGEVAPIAPTPVPVVVASPGPDVMAHRFGIGINLGTMSVSPHDAATPTDFRTSELALRFRATPHLELELLLSGGRQVLEDSTDGDLAMGGGTLAARYRFRPGHRWDWWLSAGLGATVIERHISTEQQRADATRGHFAFGVGLERRWQHLALHAELRMMAIGARDDADVMTLPIREIPDVRTAEELTGGVFNVGASFYF
jgi:opacity protein-like surface antigen